MSDFSKILDSFEEDGKNPLLKLLNTKIVRNFFDKSYYHYDNLAIIFCILIETDYFKSLKPFFQKLIEHTILKNELEFKYAVTENVIKCWQQFLELIKSEQLCQKLNIDSDIFFSSLLLFEKALKIKKLSLIFSNYQNIQVWNTENIPDEYKQIIGELNDVDWIVFVPAEEPVIQYGIPSWIEAMDAGRQPEEFQLLTGSVIYIASH